MKMKKNNNKIFREIVMKCLDDFQMKEIMVKGKSVDIVELIDKTVSNVGFSVVNRSMVGGGLPELNYLISHNHIGKIGDKGLITYSFSYINSDDTLLINTTDNIMYGNPDYELLDKINNEIKVGEFDFHPVDTEPETYVLYHSYEMYNFSENIDKFEELLTDIDDVLTQYLSLINKKCSFDFESKLENYIKLIVHLSSITDEDPESILDKFEKILSE